MDREKVIGELFKFREEMRTCDSTTYVIASKKVMRMDLIDKTISPLKAQEPRVMIPGDFDNNSNVDSAGYLPAWVEYRRDGDWAEYWDDTEDGWSTVAAHNFEAEGYRCWTSRPTDEQREGMPWT